MRVTQGQQQLIPSISNSNALLKEDQEELMTKLGAQEGNFLEA